MVGNPNHDKSGRFSSGPGGADTGHGHNAGKGNRAVANHIKDQHDRALTHDKDAMKHMSALGLAMKKADGEYRVNFKKRS